MPDQLAALEVDDLPAHPIAAIFPLLIEPELQALTDDIVANGLLQPILLTADGKLVIDGRNRLVACRRGGVPPRFVCADHDDDVMAMVVALNVRRRNLTAGQRALAAAEAWAQADQAGLVGAGRPKKNSGKSYRISGEARDHFGKLFGANSKYVAMAHALLVGDAAAFERVKSGADDLAEAHQAMTVRLGRHRAVDSWRKQLELERPDLVERLLAGELTPNQCEVIRKTDAAALQQRRRERTMQLVSAAGVLDLDPAAVADWVRDIDPALAEAMGRPLSPDTWRRVIDTATAFFDAAGGC